MDDFVEMWSTAHEWRGLEIAYHCKGCQGGFSGYDLDPCLNTVLNSHCSSSDQECRDHWKSYVKGIWTSEGANWSHMVCDWSCDDFSESGDTCRQAGFRIYKLWAGISAACYCVLGAAMMAVTLVPCILLPRYRKAASAWDYENDMCLDDSDSP